MPTAREKASASNAAGKDESIQRVKIKDRGDATDHQRIGEITVATDANGQVTWVDFGGAQTETD